MAFFKFRKDGAEPAAPAPAAESLEAMRKRARHRLIGAAALVLVGVIGFPLLFDSQPRPIDVDVVINIPEKTKVAPLAAGPTVLAASQPGPAAPVKAAPSEKESLVQVETAEKAAAPVLPAVADKAVAKADVQKPVPADTKIESKPAAKSDAKANVPAELKPSAKADSKATDAKSPAEAAKAQTLLDGKEPASTATPPGTRYVVQVGAFADMQKAHEARRTLEKAGLKTYTQVVTTSDGKRTRVRVGPFPTKAEVDKAAEKIKSLNLPAQVLTL